MVQETDQHFASTQFGPLTGAENDIRTAIIVVAVIVGILIVGAIIVALIYFG